MDRKIVFGVIHLSSVFPQCKTSLTYPKSWTAPVEKHLWSSFSSSPIPAIVSCPVSLLLLYCPLSAIYSRFLDLFCLQKNKALHIQRPPNEKLKRYSEGLIVRGWKRKLFWFSLSYRWQYLNVDCCMISCFEVQNKSWMQCKWAHYLTSDLYVFNFLMTCFTFPLP